MSAWEAQQVVWAQQAAHLSAVAAKHPSQLALTSGEWWSMHTLMPLPLLAILHHRAHARRNQATKSECPSVVRQYESASAPTLIESRKLFLLPLCCVTVWLSARATPAAGEDWRNKQELLSALEVAVPAAAAALHGRKRGTIGMDGSNADGMDGSKGSIGDGGPVGAVACAGGNWMSSLRNANERLLQVGG
jgi:hypothetical protein